MSQFKNKVIAITGGSNGLGLVLAEHFQSVGCEVVIIARDLEKLTAISSRFENVNHVVADVTEESAVRSVVSQIVELHGRIDVWINNVGVSSRSNFVECGPAEYQAMLDINFQTSVRCTLAVLPHLEQTSGTVVNIGSLASKTGWRNMAPYSVSKHALAAFNHQLRLEGPANVQSLLVCPGPIRRDDAGSRYSDQAKNLDPAAAQPGAGVKLKGVCPKLLAKKVERAILKRKKELVVPGYASILFALMQLSPSLGDWILRKFAK